MVAQLLFNCSPTITTEVLAFSTEILTTLLPLPTFISTQSNLATQISLFSFVTETHQVKQKELHKAFLPPTCVLLCFLATVQELLYCIKTIY